jgi:GNAT superfamily N-acetyltransferase
MIDRPSEFELRLEPVRELRGHARISSRFEARTVFDISDSLELVERGLVHPYCKNYDDFEDPLSWPRSFDTANWILIAAFANGIRAGGAVVAAKTPGIELLEGRSDLAVLWDLRVALAQRRRGLGRALFAAAQAWAREVGCTELKVETQNTNPAACLFYMHNGCVLSQVRRGAYRGLPDDVQLIWRKRLDE